MAKLNCCAGWPMIAVLATTAVLSGVNLVFYSSPWGYPLSFFLYLWLIYTFGHLGIAYVLAGLFATPGCEMRSIPYLLGALSGEKASEHECQGLLDVSKLDEWERGRTR